MDLCFERCSGVYTVEAMRFVRSRNDLAQCGGFCFGLNQDRDVWVGIFSEAQEILVSGLGSGRIARDEERFGQT